MFFKSNIGNATRNGGRRSKYSALLLSMLLSSGITCTHQMRCEAAEEVKVEITLGDLRDVGLTLMQIKQQAINIFLEVTRKEVPKSARPELIDIDRISLVDIKPDAKYLPTRPEWLTVYVGTMEPIIRLLGADVTDVRGGVEKVMVPKGNRAKFEKLYETHEKDVAKLNEHLSRIYDGIGGKTSNAELAREAVYIFEVAQAMERNRVEAFHLLQSEKGVELEVLPIPEKK